MTDFLQTDPNAVTVLNITTLDPVNVAQWAGRNILGLRLPEPGPNVAVSTITPRITELLAQIPNRMALASELHGIVSAALANQRVAKRFSKDTDTENAITTLTALQEILYRAIQTLQTLYDGASRMLTAAAHQMKQVRQG